MRRACHFPGLQFQAQCSRTLRRSWHLLRMPTRTAKSTLRPILTPVRSDQPLAPPCHLVDRTRTTSSMIGLRRKEVVKLPGPKAKFSFTIKFKAFLFVIKSTCLGEILNSNSNCQVPEKKRLFKSNKQIQYF